MGLLRNHLPAKTICLIASFSWVFLLLHKYYCLGYYDWDFAFFSQAMWSLCHGSAHVSLFDINFFSNHANLIALILVPLYKIFPHPISLLLLKIISFCAASYILYLLAEEKLGLKIALIILTLYWLYPPNIFGLLYEFDFENLSLAFLMLSFYYYTKEKWVPFMISSVLLMTVKENMPLIVAAFGIHGFFTRSNKIYWGLVPVFVGIGFFYLLAFIFVPLMGNHGLGHHPYSSHYSDLNLLAHPLNGIWHIVTAARLQMLITLFVPLLLSIFSPGILFLISPIIMQHFLSNEWQEHTIYYGYSLTIAPFIFLAFINTLTWIKENNPKSKFYLILLIISLISSMIYLIMQTESFKIRYMNSDSPVTAAYGWQLLNKIPPQAGVVASFRFLPELSQRPDVYSFHKIYDPLYQNKYYSYKLPENVHYALIDFHDTWLLGRLADQKQATKAIIQDFIIQNKWKIKYNVSGIMLLER